jgi:hypothetical protein
MIGKLKIHIAKPKMLALAEVIGLESLYPNTFKQGRTACNWTQRVSMGNAVYKAH